MVIGKQGDCFNCVGSVEPFNGRYGNGSDLVDVCAYMRLRDVMSGLEPMLGGASSPVQAGLAPSSTAELGPRRRGRSRKGAMTATVMMMVMIVVVKGLSHT